MKLVQLTSTELPSLYVSADAASRRGQAKYLALIRYDLFALVAGAALSAYAPKSPETARLIYAASALLMVVGLILTIVVMQKQFEQQWYGGRAAAESVKSVAWRYAMRAEPFHGAISEQEARQKLQLALKEVLAQSKQLRISLPGGGAADRQVSSEMSALRVSDLATRKDVYLRDRIASQREWYSLKADYNRRRESRLFALTVVCQLIGVGYAVTLVAVPTLTVNATGTLTTGAAALLVWLQAKQHQELAQSYAVTAHELGLIEVQAENIASDAQFAVFVGDAEAAISREHTLWVARRDQLPRISPF